MSDRLPPIAKTSEVAKYLRYSEPTVRELARTGQLPPIRKGRILRFTREQVEAFALRGGEN